MTVSLSIPMHGVWEHVPDAWLCLSTRKMFSFAAGKKGKKKKTQTTVLALNKKVLIHINVGESGYYHTYILGSG